MRRKKAWLVLYLIVVTGLPLWGQSVTTSGPVREQEMLTLTEDMPFDQALRAIQTFAHKAIVDPQHLTQPIGVDIDRETWRQALEKIAASNGMRVASREHYLELVSAGAVAVLGEDAPPLADLDSREVNISAVFFQADRGMLRELGVDWSTLSGGRVDVSASHMGARQVVSDQFTIGMGTNLSRSLSVDLLIKTFESENRGEITAKPQIRVQSGKVGHIQVGTDFSVTTTDFAGNTITDFVGTGTILDVEPVIITEEGQDFVVLKVMAERSALVDPVRHLITKTTASTSTLLRDGEQTAIAGLYGEEMSTTRSGMPLLKSLPTWFFGLGLLFGHDSKLVTETELVVMMQVDIVPSIRQRIQQELDRAEAEDAAPEESE